MTFDGLWNFWVAYGWPAVELEMFAANYARHCRIGRITLKEQA